MGERYAIKTGNWSDVTMWDGATTLPGALDDVFANGFTVAIDQTVTVLSISTKSGATAVAGGAFADTGAQIINANTFSGSASRCLFLSESGSTVNGDVTGGTGNGHDGVYFSAGCILNGGSYGGSASGCQGAVLVDGAIQNGNSFGGSASTAYGSYLTNHAVQNGDATGGSQNSAAGTSCLYGGILNGDSYGGSSGVGVEGANLRYGSVQYGNSYGGSAVGSEGSIVREGSIQIGNATGGSATSTHGTRVYRGGLFEGEGNGGGVSGAWGLYVYQGGCAILSGVTDTSAPGCQVGADGHVILRNGVVEGDLTGAGTRTEVGLLDPFRPFINPAGGGIYNPFKSGRIR